MLLKICGNFNAPACPRAARRTKLALAVPVACADAVAPASANTIIVLELVKDVSIRLGYFSQLYAPVGRSRAPAFAGYPCKRPQCIACSPVGACGRARPAAPLPDSPECSRAAAATVSW